MITACEYCLRKAIICVDISLCFISIEWAKNAYYSWWALQMSFGGILLSRMKLVLGDANPSSNF